MAFNNITKHPTLWFDDGNVVLIAENTGFRVYRGLLARHSDIFRDMFSVPQPQTAAEDSFDGCPVVRMPDDSADDVAIVLGILYEDSESFYGQNYRIPFRTAAAALQLGTKYLFDAIRREALKRIAVCFPKDLKELHAHDHGGYFQCRACPIIWDKAAPIAVFHFARRLALDDLIPAALYRCAHSMTIPQLFSAINNPDASYYSLSLKELEDCMEAREYLFKKNVALQTTFVNNLGPDCVHKPQSSCDPTSCAAALSEMALECLEDQFMLKCDTFLDLRNWISSHSGNISEHSLCCNCTDHYISLYERRQAAVWAAFRNRFGSTPHDTQMDGEDMI